MRLPDDPTKFSSKFKYVEFAHYVEEAFPIKDEDKNITGWRPGVIRDVNIRYVDGEKVKYIKLYSWDEIMEKAKSLDMNGVYTSTFQHDGRGEKSQSFSSLYFDLDSKEDINVSHQEARRLFMYLQEVVPEQDIRLYFTGQKGFHIECEAITLGIGPAGDLAEVFRLVAGDLQKKLDITSMDFQVYDPRRMWRIPNSCHQFSGRYKIPLTPTELLGDVQEILSLAETPREMAVPEPVFDPPANEWFREYVYENAQPTLSQEEMFERFARHGTGMVRDVGEMEFTPKRLFDGCPALLRLWEKAETNHHLEHEERLWLCSILTYSEQAIEYLHAILSNCTDYNYAKSNSHIQDWIRRRELGIGGRPYSCARANSAGIGCGSCDLEPKEKYQVIGDRMVPTGEMASPSPIRLAYQRKEKK